MRSEGVERATAAVFVNGRRRGSAVPIDRGHALTARHVVGRQSPAPTEVDLRFPAADARVPAVSVDSRAWTRELDVTLLEFTGDLPASVEVPEWLPFAGVADRVGVFGYPLEEVELNGIWVEATATGMTATGALQIDAIGAVSSLRGHSGGPVVDTATGAVIGVLVEGSAQLRFDRAIPIELIAVHGPVRIGWWMFAGDNAVEHFRSRATGQRSIVHGGDLFKGRGAALGRIRQAVVDQGEMPLVITGQPGAGKSTVLARAALAERGRAASSGLAFHARGQGVAQLVRAVARVAAAPAVSAWQELVRHLTEHPVTRLAIFVDALDEMATDQDVLDTVRFARELSSLSGLSVTVATRWRAPGGDRRVRDLPSQLGATAANRRDTLVDLDSDRYFEAADLRAYAEAVLCQTDARQPGPRGAAWETYRDDHRLRRDLVDAVARRAERNYLVAAMAAFQLSESDEVVDPRRRGFDERRDLPGTVGEALDKYLHRLPPERRQRTAALLLALSYGEGSGLTDDRWRSFTEALGYTRPSLEELDSVRVSGAADYLLQQATAGSERTTRLFHQALIDHLHQDRDVQVDQRRLAACLISELPMGDWSGAAPYLRQHAPAHLTAGGVLDEHLGEARFLLAVSPERLIRVLPAASSPAARRIAHVYELAFHQLVTKPSAERPAYLQLAASCAGHEFLAAALRDAVTTAPWGVVWSQCSPPQPHRVVGRHRGTVRAVALTELEGEEVVVSGGDDGTVRVWRLDGEGPVGEPWQAHAGRVQALALGELDAQPVLVCGGEDGTLRVWWLDGGAPVGEPWHGHSGPIVALAVGELDGEPVVVSGGGDETLLVRRLDRGTPVGDACRGHRGTVMAVAVGDVAGRPVVVSGGEDGTVRVWWLASGAPVGEPWDHHQGGVFSLAVGRLHGVPVVVSSGDWGVIRVSRLDGGTPVGEPWRGHDGFLVRAVAVGEVDGEALVVSGGGEGALQVWRLDGGAPVGQPLRGHDSVAAVALGRLKGRPMAVSGGADGTVRMWEADTEVPTGTPWRGHDFVNAVAVAEREGRPVVVSVGGVEGAVRVWLLESGDAVGDPWHGHEKWLYAVSVGEVHGRSVVATGGEDGTVRLWDLTAGIPMGEPLRGHEGGVFALVVGHLGGDPVVVSGGDDGTVRVWRLDGGAPVGEPWRGHDGPVWALALGELEGRQVVVTGGVDGTTRAWELAGGAPIGRPWRGHDGAVRSVVVAELEDQPVVVSGGDDGTVRVWRLDGGVPIGEPRRGHEGAVSSVAVGRLHGRSILISGAEDGTLVVWPRAGGRHHLIDLGSAVQDVELAPPGQVVAATTMGIVSLRLGSGVPWQGEVLGTDGSADL